MGRPSRTAICPWCQTAKIVVVKKEMIYLPKHAAGGIRNKECKGSNMPIGFNRDGEEPTDRWQ